MKQLREEKSNYSNYSGNFGLGFFHGPVILHVFLRRMTMVAGSSGQTCMVLSQFTLTSFYIDFDLFSKFAWVAANMLRYRSKPEDAGQVPA